MPIDLKIVADELDLLERKINQCKEEVLMRKENDSFIALQQTKDDIKLYNSQHLALKKYLNTIARFV